ncbi:MAG: ABC transporter substrate-binding protein [Clostridiales Family XIII bacterium]|jgi:peptide/nickel transport system substrate-binding protein|nr:ABC transporter substrate-binding protein [Clostridiales Family XIII bacterium]
MKMNKIRVIAIVLITCLLFTFAACSGGGAADGDAKTKAPTEEQEVAKDAAGTDHTKVVSAASAEPTYGGTLNVWKQEFQNDFDPGADTRANQETLWYESLWAMDWGLNDSEKYPFTSEYITGDIMMGQLAESWEADYDKRTFTVKLREGVNFQDKEPYNGRPLVAADVKWSYDRLLGIGSGYTEPVQLMGTNWPEQLQMIESIDTPDDATVVFNLRQENSNETGVNDLMIQEIMIAGHEWDELTDEQKKDWHYAAGTGPFILDEYVLDNHMHFVKNENYYGYDERYPDNKLPYVDEVNLTVIAESSNRLTQFVSGEIDFMSGTNPLNSSERAQLDASVNADKYWYLNKNTGAIAIGLKQNNEPFKDIRVRQALQMAINSAEIHSDYYKLSGDMNVMGLFNTSTDYSDVANWGQDVYDSYAVFDPDAAKKLLADAGYPDGFEFTTVIFGALDQNLFTLAASYLAQIGVKMNIEVAANPMEMEQAGFSKDDPRTIFKNAGFTTLIRVQLGYITGATMDAVFANDPKFDELVKNAMTANTMADRIKYAKDADKYFAEQHWILQLGGSEQMTDVFSARLGGYNGEQWYRIVYPRIWVAQ